jgi:RNA polymerase sigma factor (TIGR02999 family)
VSDDVTALLLKWSDGKARDRLISTVYGELRKIAARHLRRERPDHTLQPTALVHEAYEKLIDQRRVRWQNRAHFYGVAAQVMRRILVDHARRRAAQKRSGGERVTLDGAAGAETPADVEVIALDDALAELATFDPGQARIVELRYFAGLTADDAAEAMGVSRSTLQREWALARAWLHRRLSL